MKVMGEAKALDWIECLLHRRDFIPGTLDLLHLPRKGCHTRPGKRKETATFFARIPRLLANGGGEGDMYPLKTCLPLLLSCHPGSTIPTTYRYNP